MSWCVVGAEAAPKPFSTSVAEPADQGFKKVRVEVIKHEMNNSGLRIQPCDVVKRLGEVKSFSTVGDFDEMFPSFWLNSTEDI